MARAAAALVLTGAIALVGHAQQPARDGPSSSVTPGTASIRGRVVAADTREPLRKARVTIDGVNGLPPAFTDAEGRFAFSDLPAGRYTLSARKAGYAATTFGQRRPELQPIVIDLQGGTIFQDAELRMPRGAAISGRIVDEFGDPIELATVTALRMMRADGVAVSSTAATANTDDLGEYRLYGLPAGTYIVGASTSRSGQITFVGERDGTRREAAGPAQARAYYPGVVARMQALPIVLQTGDERASTDFTVSAARLATLSIAFTDVKGEPAAATAMISIVGLSLGGTAAVLSRPGGVAMMPLEPGDYWVFARGQEGGVGATRVTIGPDDLAITIPLTPGGRLSGRVVSDGGPLADDATFVVDAFTPGGSAAQVPLYPTTRVNGPGTFELTELVGPRQLRVRPAAGWFVTAIMHDGRNLLGETITFSGGETIADVQVVVSDRGATVNGTAVDGTGTHIADYFVLVFPDDVASPAKLRHLTRTVRSNQNGQFTIGDLAPGTYFAVPIEDLDDVQSMNPDSLDRFRARATRITLAERQKMTVTLTMATP